ncbi:MAG: hypothetical protein LBI53_02225 [Candidatus Peribacteria bacterium]|jgi:hypothetical protein|nr:hypothetical protein [Candidatus Peribacteria bacterium]
MPKDWEKSDLIQSFIGRNTSNFNDGGGNTMWSYDIKNDRGFAFRSSVFLIENFGRTDTNGKWTDEGEWKRKTNINGEIDAFGEYKLSLDEVNYVQCIDGKWKAQGPYPRVCEVDFAVTNNYILQKTPSGTIKGTTESLAKYFMYANGTQLREDTLLGNILATTANDYQDVNGKVKTAMDNFIAKYSKLAVAVPVTSSPFGGSATVKKVPGKSIYFVEGNLDIKPSSSSASFTIVQTRGDTTIKGSISHNMMLLTKGKVTFDVEDNCSGSQVVK